jgi:hypothetical protein
MNSTIRTRRVRGANIEIKKFHVTIKVGRIEQERISRSRPYRKVKLQTKHLVGVKHVLKRSIFSDYGRFVHF